MTEHALLSASGSSRWMKCPPSARLEEVIEDEPSEYAKEGSFAHSLAELNLCYSLGNISKAQFNKELKKIKKNSFYTEEMKEYVQVYVDFAIEKINEGKAHTKDAIVLLEMKLDYSPWVPEGFGTGDLVIVTDKALEIIDLKYGKGVKVSAKDNSQMRLYALGAIHQFDCLYDIKTVKMTIAQPRLDSISTDELSIEELLTWAEKEVKCKAELAFKGEGEFKAGEHCRFCKVKPTCRARRDENMKLSYMDFKEPPLLTDEEIAEVLFSVGELQKWAKDVEVYAYNKAVNEGKKWPGLKLVEGRNSRKFRSESEVAKLLLEAGYEEDKIYSKSLLSLTALEKSIGKKNFNEILVDLITRTPGKLKLVPEEDKRPEVKNTAEADFKS
ncbi:MAG: DUF2800 domain-containing protein [Firmicutes bacterium]|nr:DUF2800 domain-containing protein [Bacillota bacterium]